MKRILFLLIIIVFCFGCEKNNSFNSSSNLIGKWSWVITCVGTGNACWTPASESYSSNIVFTSDSTYNVFMNDTLRLSTKFHTYTQISDDAKSITHIIKYDSGSWGMFSIIDDTLSLIDENGITFFTSRYKRIN
jgi:hypothetical protein